MKNSARIDRLATTLTTVDALIIDNPIDLYYLTGIELSLGRLVVDKEGRSTLLVDGRYEEVCKKEAGVPVALWDYRSPMPMTLPARVGFDAQATSFASFQQFDQEKGVEFIPLDNPVLELRIIKDEVELSCMREAAKLCVAGHDHGLRLLKEGISERELAWEIEKFWRSHGGEKNSFDPIVAFGENSSRPHHHVTNRALKQGDTVLLDLGIRLKHYHSDMTRVHFFGEPNPEVVEIYRLVSEALKRALDLCRPGTAVGEMDRVARSFIEQSGHAFVHGLGHGVGLEVHEAPRLKNGVDSHILAPGMVITVEPGIYVPGLGGVRLEEEVVITEQGYDYLIQCPIDNV